MLRLLLFLPVMAAMLLASAATLGEHVADSGFESLARVRALPAPDSDIVGDAAADLALSPSRPLLWSARAAEAASALDVQSYRQSRDPVVLARAVAAARQAVRLAPALPQTWTRLAKFALMGVRDVPCRALDCLARSWRAAPISDADTDCVRLRLAHEAGLDAVEFRRRARLFIQTGPSAELVAQCFNFLSSGERFEYLLMLRR